MNFKTIKCSEVFVLYLEIIGFEEPNKENIFVFK